LLSKKLCTEIETSKALENFARRERFAGDDGKGQYRGPVKNRA